MQIASQNLAAASFGSSEIVRGARNGDEQPKVTSSPTAAVPGNKTTTDTLEISSTGALSNEQQKVVDELETIDRKVRTHEQAHLSAAGSFARGGPTFSYQRGPDGQQYASGGEVSIDTSSVPGDPKATQAKARVIRAAASAPAEPSSQDRAVAAAATNLEIQATQEIQQQEDEAATDDPSESTSGFGKSLTSQKEPSKTVETITSGLLLDLIG